MRYDFNQPVDRTHNNSVKYDEAEKKFGRADIIPLWIADMDLRTAPAITDAIDARNRQGIFGYTARPDSYFEAVAQWSEQRYGWRPDTSLMCFALGVVPALCTIVREFSREGDSVLFMTPVYTEFFDSVKNWGRQPLTVALEEQSGRYNIDFAALEDALSRRPALFIMCHPHNPVGRVWRREELERIGRLCLKYHVVAVSDEIHADFMLWGRKHIPFASISPEIAANTITCMSVSKTFNLAGLQAATIIFPDAAMKDKFQSFWKRMDVHRNNCFSVVAVEAAYREGAEWLDQLLKHIESNMMFVKRFLDEYIPEIKTELPESTYLMWLDCRGLGLGGEDLNSFMVNEAHLGLNDGRSFGAKEGYMRLNVACPVGTLEKAMNQLRSAVTRLRGKR